MARPRKSQGAEESNNVSVENNVDSQQSEPSTAELLAMIQKLREELDKSKQGESVQEVENDIDVDNEDDEFDAIRINQDDYIKVISLTPFTLNLSTKPGGKGGKTFTFNGFGKTKRILYGDLVEILEHFGHFLENGYFYIADRRVVRKNGLDDIYNKILSKDKIEAILSGNNNDNTISLFKSCNQQQQELIIQMLVDKRIAGEELDLNLWDKLNRCTEVDMDEKYRSTKEYVESLNIKQQ